jgi:hypothetical protein
MAARDPRTNERIYERDGKYQREVFALGVQIEERKQAEAPGAQIAEHQRKQLAWLDRAQGAVGKDGKRLTDSTNMAGTTVAQNLIQSRAAVLEGRLLTPEFIANTEARFAAQGVTMPAEKAAAPVYDLTPAAPLAQATHSFIPGKR